MTVSCYENGHQENMCAMSKHETVVQHEAQKRVLIGTYIEDSILEKLSYITMFYKIHELLSLPIDFETKPHVI